MIKSNRSLKTWFWSINVLDSSCTKVHEMIKSRPYRTHLGSYSYGDSLLN